MFTFGREVAWHRRIANFLTIVNTYMLYDSNMNSPKNNHHIFEMDYLRGLAILFVISVHVSFIWPEMETITFLSLLYMSIHSFSQVAVPLFVFISGFVLYLNYQKNFPILTFYKKRFLSVVPQYLIFSTLYIVFFMGLKYLNLAYVTGEHNFSLRNIVIYYLTGGASLQMWFFVLIIELYVLYPILARFCQTIFASKKTTVIFLFILFLLPFFYHNESFILHNLDQNIPFHSLIWTTGLVFLHYLFYFITGMYFSLKYNDMKEFIHNIPLKMYLIPLLFFNILGVIFLVGAGIPEKIQFIELPSFIIIGSWIFSFIEPLFFLIIFLLLFVLVLNLNTTEFFSRYLKRIGDFSFGIFLVEVFFLTSVTIILGKINFTPYNYLYFPVVFLSTLLLSIVTIMVIRKVPFSQYIIGKIRDED